MCFSSVIRKPPTGMYKILNVDMYNITIYHIYIIIYTCMHVSIRHTYGWFPIKKICVFHIYQPGLRRGRFPLQELRALKRTRTGRFEDLFGSGWLFPSWILGTSTGIHIGISPSKYATWYTSKNLWSNFGMSPLDLCLPRLRGSPSQQSEYESCQHLKLLMLNIMPGTLW